MKTSSSSLKKICKYIAIIIFWLLVWELANFLIDSRIIIVSPRTAFARLFELGQTANFWQSIFTSMSNIMRGFGMALVAGIVIAAISSKVKLFHMLILPAINVMNAIPFASFIILALFALGDANLSVFVPFVMVLPIIFHNTYKGILNTDPHLLEMAQLFHVPYWKKIVYIYLKTVAPYILSAAQVGIGFAWKSGIAAELFGVVRGTIGGNLHSARIYLETADLFAWTITIVILSYTMEKLFLLLFGRVKNWQSS